MPRRNIRALSTRFVNALAFELAREGLKFAIAPTTAASSHLGRYLANSRVKEEGRGVASFGLPHYWARYLNDGHNGIEPRTAQILVWFPDKRDDPRFQGAHTPIRQGDARRLTKREFYDLKRQNKLRFAESVGPMKGKRFFDNDGGMSGSVPKADKLAADAFEEFVEDVLKDDLNIRLETLL